MRQANAWNRMTRNPREGGHLYISKEIIDDALTYGGIPQDAPKLMVRAWPMKSDSRGTARVILKIREAKE